MSRSGPIEEQTSPQRQRVLSAGRAKQIQVVNLNRILVPLDGTAASNRAFTHAQALAACFNCEVKLIHVVDTSQLFGYERHQVRMAEQLLEDLTNLGRTILQRASVVLTAMKVKHTEILVKGTPEPEILEASKDCDLVVMGSHGLKGFERFLLGSVTEGVLRHTHLPVLGVRFRTEDTLVVEDTLPPQPYKRILIPYNGEYFSQYALHYILPIAAGMNAEQLTLLLVTEANPSQSKLSGYEKMLEEAKETATTALKALSQGENPPTVVVQIERTTAHPAEAILNCSTDYDLIVCGTRGLTGLKRLFLGSVTEGVLRRSLVPVMAVHIPEEH
eukprot:TRINITY_DN10469_c0_g1_i1.p1 TRINITY_DN10469_c0_g1~~TRINITY_DN10469_c0_g1_i1.p1  ORF type:complete len:331 (-),score=71.78 TRINITY_DN10469_c0_g1_i1:140-1132(-)